MNTYCNKRPTTSELQVVESLAPLGKITGPKRIRKCVLGMPQIIPHAELVWYPCLQNHDVLPVASYVRVSRITSGYYINGHTVTYQLLYQYNYSTNTYTAFLSIYSYSYTSIAINSVLSCSDYEKEWLNWLRGGQIVLAMLSLPRIIMIWCIKSTYISTVLSNSNNVVWKLRI